MGSPENRASLLSAEKRDALAARARAELSLRLARLRGQKVSWEGKPLFREGCWPVIRALGPITIGPYFRLRGGPVRTRLITRETGRIEIGEGVGINFGAEITATHLVVVGDFAMIGPHATIYDTSFHSVEEGEEVKTAPVRLGTNVWIGRGALILPGVTIGDHSVVASFAVVSRDVPPRTEVAGNPARPIREIEASDGWRRIE